MEADFSLDDRVIYTTRELTLPINLNDILYIRTVYYKVKLIVKCPEYNSIDYHLELIFLEED